MANGDMPSWDEWHGLTEEQREYSLYKTLDAINQKVQGYDTLCGERKETCDSRFEKIEHRKLYHMAASTVGGVIGGIIAVIGGWTFWKGPGG